MNWGRAGEISSSRILFEFEELSSNISSDPTDQDDSEDSDFQETDAASIQLFNSTGRRFFTTTYETKSLQGLGPGWTEVGDIIAILHGARFPVILGVQSLGSKTYQVVGDCCVLEIMRGEAVKWSEEEADDIVLL